MTRIHIKNLKLLFIIFVIVWGILIPFVLKDTESTSSPEVLDQSRVTVNVKTNILTDALSTRASDWCVYNDAILGDFTISSKNGSRKFAHIFLTDSIAAKTASNYPHLFQYIENRGNISFKMKKYSFEGYVVTPVWLLEALLENNVLVIDENESRN